MLFPVPMPPLIRMLHRAATAPSKNLALDQSSSPVLTISATCRYRPGELADRHGRTEKRNPAQYGVQSRSAWKSRIDNRRRDIELPMQPAYKSPYELDDLVVALEQRVLHELLRPVHPPQPHAIVVVDTDLFNARVVHEHLEWSRAQLIRDEFPLGRIGICQPRSVRRAQSPPLVVLDDLSGDEPYPRLVLELDGQAGVSIELRQTLA